MTIAVAAPAAIGSTTRQRRAGGHRERRRQEPGARALAPAEADLAQHRVGSCARLGSVEVIAM